MMNDLISRQDAIDAIEKLDIQEDMCVFEILSHIELVIGTLPSAQQWIPCSERLPEENEVVLTKAQFKDDVKMAVSSRIDFNYWTGWGTREINIVAWMPLPEP